MSQHSTRSASAGRSGTFGKPILSVILILALCLLESAYLPLAWADSTMHQDAVDELHQEMTTDSVSQQEIDDTQKALAPDKKAIREMHEEIGETVKPDTFTGAGTVSIYSKHWEFTLESGIARPIGTHHYSILADNSAFLLSDPGSLGEDEFLENGLPSPDFSGQTLIQGDRGAAPFVGAELYYNLLPSISMGMEYLYTVPEDLDNVTFPYPFNAPIYETHYKVGESQGVLAGRFGPWIGPFRPYAKFGAGPYFINEYVTSELHDPVPAEDANHPPIQAASRHEIYGSLLYGGGIDYRLKGWVSVGIALEFQTVFKPGDTMHYVVPGAHFNIHF